MEKNKFDIYIDLLYFGNLYFNKESLKEKQKFIRKINFNLFYY